MLFSFIKIQICIMKQDKLDQAKIYRIQALDRALDILDCFSFQKREWTLSEVVAHTGLNKTTTKRMLSNLTARGYLHQDTDNKRYQLGLKLFELGGIVFSSISLRRAAASHLTRLRDETGLTVLMGIELDDHLVYVDKREGLGVIRISSEIGWRRQMSFGMLGMVIMAFMPPGRVKAFLDKRPLESYTALSLTDRHAFNLRLAQIREDGFVVEKGEAHQSIAGIAAPIRDYTRQVVAAAGVAVPLTPELGRDDEKKLVDNVRHTAEAISSDLGYLKI
jgi:DNA-binding IclR family transcriptional regulator